MDHDRLVKYLRTPAGCLGGNLGGRHWAFGLEPGGGEAMDFYRNPPIDDSQGYVADTGSPTPFADSIDEYPFAQRVAKLEAAKHGWATDDYRAFAEESRLYGTDSDFYRGNLGAFPIRRMDKETYASVADAIGIPDRQSFNEFQDEVRGPMFRQWVAEYSPFCLICFGNEEKKTQSLYRYLDIFTPGERQIAWIGKIERNHAYHKTINEGRTHLFILPHPTAQGGSDMSSDTGIAAVGALIAQRIW